MEDLENKIYELSCMKETMVTAVKAEMAKGVDHLDSKELGEAVDIIKDLAEAEKYCREACYYKTVTKAMEEGAAEDDPRYGYTKPRKWPSEMRHKPMVDQEPYIERYIREHGGDYDMDDMRMGYVDDPVHPRDTEGRYRDRPGESRYGKAYRDYQTARRHYTQTNSPTDKESMTTHATEHVADTIATIREIWRTADTDLKKRMKTDFTNLLGEMTV